MKVLFVCNGNVGRSQIAEAFYKKLSEYEAVSAGTNVHEYEEQKVKDNPYGDFVVKCMKEEGIDLSENQRKQVTPEMADEADKIVIMADHNIPYYLLDNEKYIIWEVEDPRDKPYESYCETRDKIRSLVEELIEELN